MRFPRKAKKRFVKACKDVNVDYPIYMDLINSAVKKSFYYNLKQTCTNKDLTAKARC